MSACPSENNLYLCRNDDLTIYHNSLKCVSGYQQKVYKIYLHHNITDLREPATPSHAAISILQTYNLTNWHRYKRIHFMMCDSILY